LIVSFAFLLGCSAKPTYYRGNFADGTGPTRLALLPLTNFSEDEKASDVVAGQLLVTLLELADFSIVDPGRVDQLMIDMRLRVPERLPLETLREVGQELEVRYVMLGAVNEYGFLRESGEEVPHVSISLRIVSCEDGAIAWAASHSRRGDERETVFGWGKTGTVEQMAAETVEEITKSLRK
jgi:TolB-like protein